MITSDLKRVLKSDTVGSLFSWYQCSGPAAKMVCTQDLCESAALWIMVILMWLDVYVQVTSLWLGSDLLHLTVLLPVWNTLWRATVFRPSVQFGRTREKCNCSGSTCWQVWVCVSLFLLSHRGHSQLSSFPCLGLAPPSPLASQRWPRRNWQTTWKQRRDATSSGLKYSEGLYLPL